MRKRAFGKHWTGTVKDQEVRPRRSADRSREKEAFQSFRLDEHFAGYSPSFDAEIVDEPVNGTNYVAVHHLVASHLLDIASDSFGK